MKKFYICKVCGNLVEVLEEGGGELVCCKQPMVGLVANTVEASFEKHIPVVSVNDGVVNVKVGSVEHPMTEEHYISWIYLKYDNGSQRAILLPGMKPEVSFCLLEKKDIEVYAYCNIHGLWKAYIK